ncbi:hypothetical protein B0H19DRAFT_1204404 [Mycena capillaripes]|nr:hypothetical protein B0H19DRAFT_1204404 [Mycena capillaripes]
MIVESRQLQLYCQQSLLNPILIVPLHPHYFSPFATNVAPSFDWVAPFYSLSHRTDTPAEPDSFPDSVYYNTGAKDVCLIISCIAVMADFEYERSKRLNGNGKANGNGHTDIKGAMSKKEQRHLHRSVLRFAEQGWSAVYYPLQWCFGLYVNYYLPTSIFEPTDLWRNYPHIPLAAPTQGPLPDAGPPLISVFLMGASYYFNFTRVGCLIMIAKMCRYINVSQLVCDSLFGLFLWSPHLGRFLSREYWIIFIIQILWFATICRASDDRSDEEAELDDDKKDQ